MSNPIESFNKIIGRAGMKRSANDYGKRIRGSISRLLLKLSRDIEFELKTLRWTKKYQEQYYPDIGITVEELEEFIDYIEKMSTIFRAES